MKILYGIQGTGNGHISRSRVMASYLASLGADVDYLFSGRPREQLFDMECFGDYQYRHGLSFSTEKGRVKYLASAWNNKLSLFMRDVDNLDLAAYDLVISDFEPVCAWAGKQQSIPVMGIGHQYAFGGNAPVAGHNLFSKMVMKHFAPAMMGLGLHWHRYDSTTLPPIIDTSLKRSDKPKKTVIVYLPFEDQFMVTTFLRALGDYHFIQYSSELNDDEKGNVSLRTASHQGFKRDLISASHVICSAGFELISECLHLGIPVLAKPVQGQMEQLSNARVLGELGYASVSNNIGVSSIGNWLDTDPRAVTLKMPDVAQELSQWIVSGQWEQPETLADKLWGQQSQAISLDSTGLVKVAA
jgi:uncharacterized protein (TIGR00661 family)